jgi:hypothetical protein
LIRILIDDDNFAFPPVLYTYPIRHLGVETRVIAVPRALQGSPTTVQASLGINPQDRGPAARVKLSR